MATYNTTSSKYVIAKLYRDLRLEDPNYELDFIEWLGEALEFIGSAVQLETKEAKLTVANHKAPLPVRFVSLNQLLHKDDDFGWNFIKYNPSSFNAHEWKEENFRARTAATYSLNPDYIVTSFEKGEVDISYNALPVDQQGYPLIPDNQYFREGLFWYCFKQMLLGGFQHKVAQMDYGFADSKWQFYCTAARNAANYPDIGQYQRFKEVWVGLIPPQRMFERGFDIEQPEEYLTEVVRADNLITRPLTVEKNED